MEEEVLRSFNEVEVPQCKKYYITSTIIMLYYYAPGWGGDHFKQQKFEWFSILRNINYTTAAAIVYNTYFEKGRKKDFWDLIGMTGMQYTVSSSP